MIFEECNCTTSQGEYLYSEDSLGRTHILPSGVPFSPANGLTEVSNSFMLADYLRNVASQTMPEYGKEIK